MMSVGSDVLSNQLLTGDKVAMDTQNKLNTQSSCLALTAAEYVAQVRNDNPWELCEIYLLPDTCVICLVPGS